MTDKSALLAQRTNELVDARQRLRRLEASETASIDDLAAMQMKVTTLERLLPTLRAEADQQNAKEASRVHFAAGKVVSAETLHRRLVGLRAERKALNATHVISEAQRTIQRVTAQDKRLGDEIAQLEQQLIAMN